ncbi:MAG: homoprotocatechuate degradation operon regulator HpaR [Burkholderiaceae bacterium]
MSPALTRPNLPMMLLVARDRLIARFRPLLHEHGLTEQQWRILRAVHDAGSLEPREIVASCGISSPSLAGVLARMEALGLIDRRRFDHDQRRLAIALTARSLRLVKALAPRIEAIYRQMESDTGAAIVARLIADLEAMTAALADRGDDSRGDGSRGAGGRGADRSGRARTGDAGGRRAIIVAPSPAPTSRPPVRRSR